MPVRSVCKATFRRRIARMSALGLFTLLLVALLPLTPAAAAPAFQAGPSRITILPINKARLIAGQRFDLRVEVGDNLADNTSAASFDVRVDGKPIAQYFGKEPAYANTTPQSASLTVRQVSFNAPGSHTVTVNAGGSLASATYEIARAIAPGRRAKNVILMIGDGMAFETITAARMVSKGLTQGTFNGYLEMDRLEAEGRVTTSGYDSLVTDSANSASAYATGNKSVVNAMGVYADDTKDTFDDPRVENIIELVKRTRGMATGLVTTSEIEDATPAAMFAHTRRRAEKQYIADQLLDDPAHRPEVIMGGGSAYFIPKSTAGSKRTDERNLLEDFRAAGYAIAGTRAEVGAAGTPQRILGLFHPADMNVWIDREYTKDAATLGPYTDQPPLYEMTQKALDVLSTTPNGRNGFFLMVEGASIDKQLHPLDWQRAVGDVIEFDKSIGVAKRFAAANPDTLIVVVADHAHSVSVYGTYDTTKGPGNRDAIGVYDTAKFPTFKDSDGDSFPDDWNPSRTLAVGFGNHPDYRDDFIFNPTPLSPTIKDPSITGRDVYIPNPKRDPQGVLISGNLPFFEATEVHSADDAPLFASGPNAAYFNGLHNNIDVFLGITAALGIDATRSRGQSDGDNRSLLYGTVIGLAVVVGASRYLRRPGTGGNGLATQLLWRLKRVAAAARVAAQSFRDTLDERK